MCGATRFTAEPAAEAGVCHCSMCRKWSGGMFIGVACGDSLTFEEGAPLNRFASSDWGERVSCAKCGSSLVWQMRDGSLSVASVQCFDDPGVFPVTSQIFIDCKPESYALANETAVMTEAEVIAKFAPQAEG